MNSDFNIYKNEYLNLSNELEAIRQSAFKEKVPDQININNRISNLAKGVMKLRETINRDPSKDLLIASALDKNLETLSESVKAEMASIIGTTILQANADSSMLSNFAKLDQELQSELAKDPQIIQHLISAILEAYPGNLSNFFYDAHEAVTHAILQHKDLIDQFSEDQFKFVYSTLISNRRVEGLRALLNCGRLPFDGLMGADVDMLTAIESDGILGTALAKELQEAKNSLGDDDALHAYRSLAKNLVSTRMADTLRAIKLEAIDHDFQLLIDKNVRGAKKAKEFFDASDDTCDQRESLKKAKEIFDQPVSEEAKAQNAYKAGKDIVTIIKNWAWVKQDDELLSEIERYLSDLDTFSTKRSPEQCRMDKVIANVALDKMLYQGKESYKGGSPNWVIPYFTRALNRTLVQLRDPNYSHLSEAATAILTHSCYELREQLRWTNSPVAPLSQGPDEAADLLLQSKELVKRLNSLSQGESCLVPSGSRTHSTLMRVEKTGEQQVRILYYNTGNEIEKYHPKGKKEKTYQTFIEYRAVPIASLQDPEIWKSLIEKNFSDMAPPYEKVDQLCREGVKQAASPHQEFYEAQQEGGSCTYQCILAMIRERLVSSLSDPTEGLGLYKIVKGLILNEFEKMSRGLRNETIDRAFQAKLKVVGIELKMANALVNPSERENLLKQLVTELKAQNLDALAEKLEQSRNASSLVLFTHVRETVDTLVSLHAPITTAGLVKEAVESAQEKEDFNRPEIKKLLDALNGYFENQTPERVVEFAVSFCDIFLRPGVYRSMAVDWMVISLNQIPKDPDDQDPQAVLLKILIRVINYQGNDQREKILTQLLKGYERAGNHSMVAYLQEACSGLI